MRRRPSVLLIALALVPGVAGADEPAPAEVASPTPQVYFAGNAWYSVASDRVAAANYVGNVADAVAGALARLGFSPADLRGKVTVYATVDDAPVTFEDDARRTLVRVPLRRIPGAAASSVDMTGDRDHGHTLVRVPLRRVPDAATTAEFASERAVARALASGALRRLARAAGRTPAPADWIVEAIAWEAQIAMRPGLLEWLARTADEQGPGTLAQVEAPNPDGLGSHSRAALILLRAVAAGHPSGNARIFIAKGSPEADDAGRLRRFVANAALGLPLVDSLRAAMPRIASDKDGPEIWWAGVFYREIDRRPSVVAPPGGSARRFAELTRFVVWDIPAGETAARDLVLDPAGLVARRADKSVAAEAERRIVEIKRELLTVNPVWFNALRDYGVFLEKLPSATPEELSALAAQTAAEAASATTLTAEIERALRGGWDVR